MNPVQLQPDRILVSGPIPADRPGEIIARWSGGGQAGAVVTFAGMVRADRVDGGTVTAIEFSAHEEMADRGIRELVARLIADLPAEPEAAIHAVHVEHALGRVPVGGIPIVIAVAAGHRAAGFRLCEAILEDLKREVPIYGKELVADGEDRWKVNR